MSKPYDQTPSSTHQVPQPTEFHGFEEGRGERRALELSKNGHSPCEFEDLVAAWISNLSEMYRFEHQEAQIPASYPDQSLVLSSALPDFQTLRQTCAFYQNRLKELCNCFSMKSPLEAEEARKVVGKEYACYRIALELTKALERHELSAVSVDQCLKLLRILEDAKSLQSLFQKLYTIPQISSPNVKGFIDVTLKICNSKPNEVTEISRDLSNLFDKPEVVPLIISLTTLADSTLVSELLDTVRLQPEDAVLTACTGLIALLSCFEKNCVSTPNCLHALRRRPNELTQLVKNCMTFPSCMIELSAKLVEALDGTPEVELVLFMSTLAVELLQEELSAEIVKELGLMLFVASKNLPQVHIVKKLQANFTKVKHLLINLLNRRKKINILELEKIFSPLTENMVLVEVKDRTLRTFDCHARAWGKAVQLNYRIQADAFTCWVLLKDGRVFCSGGGKSHTGYYSSGTD